jgi:hypothetical protein
LFKKYFFNPDSINRAWLKPAAAAAKKLRGRALP